MLFKVLKSFISSIGTFNEGDVKEVELDEATSKMWIEHGLIEAMKKAVSKDADK
jgi:ribosomal protein S16